MHKMCTDLFQSAGNHYLIKVDRYSGHPFVSKLSQLSTSAVLRAMEPIFQAFGYLHSIRSDGGPQCRSEFKTHGIIHEVSSPYNSQSNGHVEAAVKNVKHALQKVGLLSFWQPLTCEKVRQRQTSHRLTNCSSVEDYF